MSKTMNLTQLEELAMREQTAGFLLDLALLDFQAAQRIMWARREKWKEANKELNEARVAHENNCADGSTKRQ